MVASVKVRTLNTQKIKSCMKILFHPPSILLKTLKSACLLQ